jgi:metal-dependent amidase/aminoacylase/carboxypeptidase family protein
LDKVGVISQGGNVERIAVVLRGQRPGMTACGHNLIAICGLGAGAALKAALIKFDIPGKVKVIGTPGEPLKHLILILLPVTQAASSASTLTAEEGGGGKIALIRKGVFKTLDTCSMAHPSGDAAPESKLDGSCTIDGPGSLARSSIVAEFFGKGAHAGVSECFSRFHPSLYPS